MTKSEIKDIREIALKANDSYSKLSHGSKIEVGHQLAMENAVLLSVNDVLADQIIEKEDELQELKRFISPADAQEIEKYYHEKNARRSNNDKRERLKQILSNKLKQCK